MNLSPDNEEKFLDLVYQYTMPVSPHHANMIASIIETDIGKHDWRFKNQVFCPCCHREMTALDYFMAALQHHNPAFIKNQILTAGGSAKHYVSNNKYYGKHFKVQLVDHFIHVTCITCGCIVISKKDSELMCGAYLYLHPGTGTLVLRMSKAWHDKLLDEVSS